MVPLRLRASGGRLRAVTAQTGHAVLARVCEWPGCERAARNVTSKYCPQHRPFCAVARCPKRAEPERTRCRQHRADRKGTGLGGRQPKHQRPQPAECTADGCDRRTLARGLCEKHYRRLRRQGTTADPYTGVYCRFCAERALTNDQLCRVHRRRLANGRIGPIPRINAGQVCIEQDGRPALKNGLCSIHHWRRYNAIRRERATVPTGQPLT